MRRYESRHRILAIGLAALAGFVDALGFLSLRGMFVSFMSGNSTRMAVGAATSVHDSLFAGALIVAFVGGVMAGAAAGAISGRWRKAAVLGLVLTVLALAGAAERLLDRTTMPTLLMAFAMGTANAVFQRDGEVSDGVTYMTGTLVKLGQHLASALSGGARFTWVPYLLLWLGLVVGAITGAAVYPTLGLQALWIAVGWTAALLIATLIMGVSPGES